MNIHSPFPPHRHKGSKRNGGPLVCDQFADCCLPGHALYELKPLPEIPELDFVVEVESVGRVGIQVKAGKCLVDEAD